MPTVKDSLDVLNRKYGICIIGEGNVGISSFVYSYIYKRYIDDAELEIEELFTKTIWRGLRSYDITILGGSATQEYYLSTRKQQIRNTTALIFAYSIVDKHSFANLEDLYERTMNVRGDMTPFIIVGLRCDLEAERQVSYEEGYSLCERLGGVHFQECSAKDGVGIIEAFDPIVDVILSVKYDKTSKRESSTTNKKNTASKSRRATSGAISKAAVKMSKTTEDIPLIEEKAQMNESQQLSQLVSEPSSTSLIKRKNYSLPEVKKDLPDQACCIIM